MSEPSKWAYLRSIALVACALAHPAAPGPGQKSAKPSQKEISKELRELYTSDQKDQNDPTWTTTNEAEFSQRQKVRRDRAMEIIEAEMLASLADWDCAAMLLQHGESADDYLLAHILSTPCGIADQGSGKFMTAATLDRFLHSVGRAQIFTTQSGAADPSVYAPMEPFDDSMSQGLRARFGLEPVRGAPAGSEKEKKGKGPGAKDLPKLLERSRKESADGKERPEWLEQARLIAAGGTLESEKEFDLAARILLASPQSEDLLWAHVMALAAAFKSRSDGARAFCAETLDRLLLSLDRKQRFDTVRENGVPKEPRAPVQAFIRREYGLAK